MNLTNEIVKRSEKWLEGKPQNLVQLQLNPTDRCNLKCIFCWQRDDFKVNYENELKKERYFQLIDEAADLNVKSMEITGGGEPLCREDVTLSLIKEIKKKNMFGSLITNGTLFNENNIKKIVKSGWDEIIFSLDSPFRETNDKLRAVQGSFDKVIRSIELFNRYKEEKPKICIHTVLCNKNYNQIPDMFKLAEKLKCKNIFFEPVVTVTISTKIADGLKLNDKQGTELQKYIREAKKIASKFRIENNLQSLETGLIDKTNKMDCFIKKEAKNNFPICFEPFYNMVVRPNGRTGPCCMFDYSPEYLSEKSIKEIWHGKFFNQMRYQLIKGKLQSYCSKCNPSQVVNNKLIREGLECKKK